MRKRRQSPSSSASIRRRQRTERRQRPRVPRYLRARRKRVGMRGSIGSNRRILPIACIIGRPRRLPNLCEARGRSPSRDRKQSRAGQNFRTFARSSETHLHRPPRWLGRCKSVANRPGGRIRGDCNGNYSSGRHGTDCQLAWPPRFHPIHSYRSHTEVIHACFVAARGGMYSGRRFRRHHGRTSRRR